MRMLLLVPLSTLAVIGCGGSTTDDGVAWSTTVDTLGDTIAVRTSGAESPPRHGIVIDRRVGTLEGAEEYTFGAITDVVVAPDEGFYVFDRQAMQLRRYDSTGTFVRNVGRRGAGPGEYDRVNGVDVGIDGRVYVWDAGNTRVSMFTPHGEPDGSFRVLSGLYTSNALTVDSSGVVFTRDHVFGPDVSKWRPIIVRHGPDGASVDTIDVPVYDLPSSTIVSRTPGGGATSSREVPFAPARQWALMPDMRFISGRSDAYALHRELPDGKVLRIERAATPVPVSDAERSEQEEITTHIMRDVNPSWRWNGPPIPESKPYFKALESALDGRVWVRLSQPGELSADPDTARRDPEAPPPQRYREPQVWDVFEADGRYLGQIELPDEFTLHAMRGEHVWGVLRDELDVQYVVRARIDPPLAPTPSRDLTGR